MRARKTIREEFIIDDEYYYKIIRHNIKKYRLDNNLTQQELADLTGYTREYICDIENQSRNKHFSLVVLTRISFALNKDIKDFFMFNSTLLVE